MAELGRAALLVTLGLSVYALVAGGLAAWRGKRREERGEERVPRGVSEPALAAPRGEPSRDECVDRKPEGDEERRAAELGHQCLLR